MQAADSVLFILSSGYPTLRRLFSPIECVQKKI